MPTSAVTATSAVRGATPTLTSALASVPTPTLTDAFSTGGLAAFAGGTTTGEPSSAGGGGGGGGGAEGDDEPRPHAGDSSATSGLSPHAGASPGAGAGGSVCA